LRADLESVWRDEVLPVFDAQGQGEAARRYLEDVRERFLNPFLDHRLADIARNHGEKKERRLRPVVAMAAELGLGLAQPRLNEALRTATAV
jgi:tagaturonate reductase